MTNEHSDSGKIFRFLYIAFLLVIIGAALILIINSTLDSPVKDRVGAVFSGAVNEPGWNGANYSGINSACKSMDIELFTCENVPEEREACFRAVSSLAEQKCRAIFLTSYGYARYANDLSAVYPRISFYVNGSDSVNTGAVYYLGRLYQMRYLSGIIAGATTKTGTIGYVAAMPNNEVNRGINAFTLGVRRAAPDAVVRVIFTGAWDAPEEETAAVGRLKELGADVIAYHQNRESVPAACEAAGLDFIGMYGLTGDYSSHLLTSVQCRWSKIYTELIRDMNKGNAKSGRICWLGIKEDAVALSEFSDNVTEKARYEIYLAEDELSAGKLIFSGEIYDNKGVLRCAKDETIPDHALLYGMDWYTEGVVTDEAE